MPSPKSAFTNDEILAVDQSGHPGIQKTGGFHPVWIADAGDGDYYVALYNFTAFPDRVDVRWSDLGFKNAVAVRDLWNHADLGAPSRRVQHDGSRPRRPPAQGHSSRGNRAATRGRLL